MDKLGDAFLDLNQSEATNIDDVNLNAVWVELDKGLLSDNIGQQCESIVKLTELFDRYQLPVFVNGGFLRLGKVFQNGNNFLKLQVIRVIEKNQKHLEKVLNVDELSKLVFYNIHSNDSVCRALTLRALGSISAIISDKHNVQHSIRLALESHDELEAKEAIVAANKFCSVSNAFAASLFDRISEIIEDIESQLDRKMKLIPLLVHMHHDTILSAKANDLCQKMFYSYPRADISKIILNTLTQIACKSLTSIHETISFFIKLLHEEPREKIHLLLLRSLRLLAERVAHLWTSHDLRGLVAYTRDKCHNELLLASAAEILRTLARHANIFLVFMLRLHESNNVAAKEPRSAAAATTTTTTTTTTTSNKLDHHRDDGGGDDDDDGGVMLRDLVEVMLFHANKSVAFSFCQLATHLLVLQSKNRNDNSKNNNNNNTDGVNVNVPTADAHHTSDYTSHLFALTKSALFAIVLDCDKEIEVEQEQRRNLILNNRNNSTNSNNDNGDSVGKAPPNDDSSLQSLTKYLKNALRCTIDLVQVNNVSAFTAELVRFINSLLSKSIGLNSAIYYCETLLTLCRFPSISTFNSNTRRCATETAGSAAAAAAAAVAASSDCSDDTEKQQYFIRSIFMKLVDESAKRSSKSVNDDNTNDDGGGAAALNLQLKLINLLLELQARKLNSLPSASSSSTATTGNYAADAIARFLAVSGSSGGDSGLWASFKVARMCVRYAHYELAETIYERMAALMGAHATANAPPLPSTSTSDLSYRAWFEFMSLLCKAERLLGVDTTCNGGSGATNGASSVGAPLHECITRLNMSLAYYTRAQTLFKASCTRCLAPSAANSNYSSNAAAAVSASAAATAAANSSVASVHSLDSASNCFQIRYCELRSEQIKIYAHLLLSSLTYRTVPPPVFQFKSSAVGLAKFGRIAQQLKYLVVELQKLNQKYKEFIAECFDGDQHTINILNICKAQNERLIFCINMLSSPKPEQSVKEFHSFLSGNSSCGGASATLDNLLQASAEQDGGTPSTPLSSSSADCSAEMKMNANFCVRLFGKMNALCASDKGLNFNHLKAFQEILLDFVSFPVPLPRAFFNSLQRTQIKLIVQPNTKRTNTVQQVRNDQTLVVKIDGIVSQHYKNERPIRTIKKIQISLTTEFDAKSIDAKFANTIKYADVKTSTETPKNDYFSSNILINFPYCGSYTVHVDVYILDDRDIIWRYIAERHQILVKVEEDPCRQKLFAALAQQQQQQQLQQQQHQQQQQQQQQQQMHAAAAAAAQYNGASTSSSAFNQETLDAHRME